MAAFPLGKPPFSFLSEFSIHRAGTRRAAATSAHRHIARGLGAFRANGKDAQRLGGLLRTTRWTFEFRVVRHAAHKLLEFFIAFLTGVFVNGHAITSPSNETTTHLATTDKLYPSNIAFSLRRDASSVACGFAPESDSICATSKTVAINRSNGYSFNPT